jgi:DNA-directed RNA polymerase specialized sigma24 family protein
MVARDRALQADRLHAPTPARDAAASRFEDWLEIVESPADEANRSTWEVDRHLAVLPVRQRKIVRAIAVEGASVRNVAVGLATSEGVVRMTIHRAISRLLGAAEPPTIEPSPRNEHDQHR